MKKIKILFVLAVGIIFLLSSCQRDHCPGHGQIKMENPAILANK